MIPVLTADAAQAFLQKLEAPSLETRPEISQRVKDIIETVRTHGEHGLRDVAARLGDPTPERFELFPAEVENALKLVSLDTMGILTRAANNIRRFGEAVLSAAQPIQLETDFGHVGLDWKPIERVVCYVPGGRFPLPSTALMTAITAQVAGVSEIAIVSPDMRPETIAAGHLAGVNRFFRLGGAQAVAAAAFGVGGLFQADMVVGPGNAYVTEAKRQLQGVIGIDMLAGPSEVAIIADDNANPDWLAKDLLAQAEHDSDARAYLFTLSESLAQKTQAAINTIVNQHPELPEHLTTSTQNKKEAEWGAILVLKDLEACIDASNAMAPEHLELMVANPDALKPKLTHYGALFMGYETSVPVGDYLAGPNHTLPTARSARFSGTLSPMTFMRPQSWIKRDAASKDFMADVASFADVEGLHAHALSARCRL
jgi:histidinol dehydrogenase